MVLLLSTKVDPRGETLELLLTKHHLTSFLHFPELPDDNFLSWLLISKLLPAQLPLNTHTHTFKRAQPTICVWCVWLMVCHCRSVSLGLFPFMRTAPSQMRLQLHLQVKINCVIRVQFRVCPYNACVPQVQLWLLCLCDSEETVLYFNLVIKNQIKWAVLQLGFKAVAFQLLFSSSI